MTQSSRNLSQSQQMHASTQYTFCSKLEEMSRSTDIVFETIERLINRGANILYMKYINSQIFPYASRTLAKELVLNASWASFPLDIVPVDADPDDDLELPMIDEWAGGVLPVRDSDASGLRNSTTPARESRTNRPFTNSKKNGRSAHDDSSKSNTQSSLISNNPSALLGGLNRPKSEIIANKTSSKPKVQLSDAQIISKKFDEARKKMNVTTKAVTVDADFNVIQINEPKGLPPTLIVPKVATKKVITNGKQAASSLIPRVSRQTVISRTPKKKKRTTTKLIEMDTPVFDEEVAEIAFGDRFVCAPGVTFKDGSTVKSRPQITDSSQLTRAQFESYLEGIKRATE